MEEIYREWITDDQRFCFSFKEETKHGFEVETTIFYTSLIANQRIYVWNGRLRINKVHYIDVSNENEGFKLNGKIELKISHGHKGKSLAIIWANIKYQVFKVYTHVNDFQGPIFKLYYDHDGGYHPHDDDDEHHEHEEPNEQNPEPRIEPERDHDLFPYTYMRSWPSLTDQELYYNFISTPQNDLSNDPFYKSLVASKKQGNASDMIQQAVAYINSDKFIKGYKDLPPIVKRYGDLYHHLIHHYDQEDIVDYTLDFLNVDSEQQLQEILGSDEYIAFMDSVWLSVLAMIVCSGYKFKWLDELIIILIVNNLLEKSISAKLSNHQVRELLHATLILPDDIFPLPPLVLSPPQSDYSVMPYAVGELQIVRQRLIGYAPGEIAKVINILPGEKKKVTNRTKESEKKRSASKKSEGNQALEKTAEHQENFELEVIKTLASYSKDHNYNDLNTNYGPPYAVKIGGTKSLAKTFKNPTKKDLSEFAKKVLNTSSQNISKKIVEWRSHSTSRETEERNTSQFDNSKGKEPITAFYKWLNKIYEARVVNYGKRLIYSLWILNPAQGYKQSEQFNKGENAYAPNSPSSFGINGYESITQENANLAALYYDIEIPNSPVNRTVSVALTQAESLTLQIPEGHEATKATVTYVIPENSECTISGAVGQKSFIANHPASNTILLTMNGETDSLPVAITFESTELSPPEGMGYIKVNIEIECQPTAYSISRWQVSTYRAITNAYQKLADEYFDKYSEQFLDGDSNPEQSNTLIKSEIKKLAISTLNEYQSSHGTSVINNLLSPPDDYLDQPIFHQFINTIFEWPEMTFQFYENLNNSGQSENWVATNNDEELLSTFLKSSAVRIMLPVDPKYSRHAILFMDTGIIWEGVENTIPSTNQNYTLMFEAKTIEPNQNEKVEDVWNVTVPTSQQIVDQNINLIPFNNE